MNDPQRTDFAFLFIVVAFDFRAPMDISAFGQNFPMAAPLPSNPTSDGYIDGKRLHMQSNSRGKPEWKAVQYYFKVDEGIKIGEGGFRICYKAFGKDATGNVIPMVAKKRMVLPYRKSALDVHRESGGTYAAVASVIEQFKQKALEVNRIQLSPHLTRIIGDIRVSLATRLKSNTILTILTYPDRK